MAIVRQAKITVVMRFMYTDVLNEASKQMYNCLWYLRKHVGQRIFTHGRVSCIDVEISGRFET